MKTDRIKKHIVLDNLWVRVPEEVMIALALKLKETGMSLDYAVEKRLFELAGEDITNMATMAKMQCLENDRVVANTIRQKESDKWRDI